MTILFRGACDSDLDAICELAELGGIGLTTLPKDIDILNKRLTWSSRSFNQAIEHPQNGYYLFVLEDTSTKNIIGSSAIEASLGHECHFYSYKLSKHTQTCPSLNIQNNYETLNLVTDKHYHSEICTLFLDPAYRHGGNAALLSRSRFLFMAAFPERFQPTVIAEMRGMSDEAGQSPFWNAVGQHFFHLSFAEADRLTLATDKQFIADLMPKNPVYVNLLPQAAQEVIGQTHPLTHGALNILLREGFQPTPYVDIFDAGPTIEAQRDEIQTIINSHVMTISHIEETVSSNRYLIANTLLDFRATIGQIIPDEQSGSCIISQETANVLQVTLNDTIRVVMM